MQEIEVRTRSRVELIDITSEVQAAVRREGIDAGICVVTCLHTTAGITIQENADPDVVTDLIESLGRIVPFDANYRHEEGNSAAHIKSSLVGPSKSLVVSGGKVVLGQWQGIYFCEFDGPRARKVIVQCAK